jgi:hypothetical protein
MMDLSEADVDFPWGRERVDFFQTWARHSGCPFPCPLRTTTRQAFLEPHVAACG